MLTVNERANLVEGIVANCDCWGREDVDVLNVFDDEKLQKLHAQAIKIKELTANAGKPAEPPAKKVAQTDEEWFLSAPPGIQSAVRNAMQIELNEKEKYVQRLTANAEADKKEMIVNLFRAKPLEELRLLASLIKEEPTPGNVFGLHRPAPSYAGAAGGPSLIGNTGGKDQSFNKDDVLVPPTLNWEEMAAER